jgi:hypothetical protein
MLTEGVTMRRLLFLIVILFLVHAPGAGAEQFLWSLSASSTDPFVNTAAPDPSPLFELHIWLACSAQGMSAASFGIKTSDLTLLGFVPCCGFLNAGHQTECPLLAIGGCPPGPIRAGYFLVLGSETGGAACITDCVTTGENITVDCQPYPAAHPNAWIGFASDGSAPCTGGFCGPIPVRDTSWGGIKSFYR